MSGVEVGVTVGNAACTMAATVASISTVGTAVGVGASVAVGVEASVAVGAGATHPMANAKTKVSNTTFIASPWVQWV